jgi:hypothetical protein
MTEKFGFDDDSYELWQDRDSTNSRTRPSAADLFEEQDGIQDKHVTLSQLLDNVVILEECMKAIIHAGRTLGVDSIRYLDTYP